MGVALDVGHPAFDLTDLALHLDEVFGQERIEPLNLGIQGINTVTRDPRAAPQSPSRKRALYAASRADARPSLRPTPS